MLNQRGFPDNIKTKGDCYQFYKNKMESIICRSKYV